MSKHLPSFSYNPPHPMNSHRASIKVGDEAVLQIDDLETFYESLGYKRVTASRLSARALSLFCQQIWN